MTHTTWPLPNVGPLRAAENFKAMISLARSFLFACHAHLPQLQSAFAIEHYPVMLDPIYASVAHPE
eukprot:3052338-Pyramimonas_sp.AAC.1